MPESYSGKNGTATPNGHAGDGKSGPVAKDQRFSASNPCPICGGHDGAKRDHGERCYGFRSGDGKWANCTNTAHAGSLPMKAGSNTFGHRLAGECKCGKRHGPADEPTPRRKAGGKGTRVETYHYPDIDGTLLFDVVRFKDPKTFRQCRPGPDGKTLWNLDGVKLVPYRLPELVASEPGSLVVVAEGEKDVEALRRLGFTATCNAMGAGKWQAGFGSYLDGKRVAVLPDNDDDGRRHAHDVARKVARWVKSVRIVELPGLPPKGDVSDFIVAKGDDEACRASILALIDSAPPWVDPGVEAPVEPEPDEEDDDPHRLARVIFDRFKHADGSTLVFHHEAFYRWKGTAYHEDEEFIHVDVVNLVKEELDRVNVARIKAVRDDAMAGGEGRNQRPPKAKKVTRLLVANVTMALRAMTSVVRDREPPAWIDPREGDPDPADVIPARNALVMLGRRSVVTLPHTPRLFSTVALPFDYDPHAPPPAAWERLLLSQWAGDLESVRELQKWFGLCLTSDLKYQKILVLIGPTRSGRSTIREVLTNLVGPKNVVTTSPLSLSDPFGLEGFLGKTLAVMGDARVGDKSDAAVMTDRMLRISGCDPVDVNRKNQRHINGVLLRTRFVIVSNEMPNVRDNGGAIVARYLPLLMKESFAGREDLGLSDRLKGEMPSILKWAIEGRRMLDADGGFKVPASARHLIDDAYSMASPVAGFVDQECELGVGLSVACDDLYEAWKGWAERNGHKPGPSNLFGRNLKAATGHKVGTTQPRDGVFRFRRYEGIALRPDAAS